MEVNVRVQREEEDKSDSDRKVNDFKSVFKFYKSMDQSTTLSKTINDIDQLKVFPKSFNAAEHMCKSFFGLNSPRTWKISRLKYPDGLIFIENPFTAEGQQYWISKCLIDYPRRPHITNIENLELRKREKSDMTGDVRSEDKPIQEENVEDISFHKKLRWVTFGYHHDWDTKVYSDNFKCAFPDELAEMTKYISLVLGFEDFKAEAAIVNYYNLDSTLSGHQDKSEQNHSAPLFSISFGNSAIFLIGGESKDVEPVPIYLRSGDIVVMSGRSRMSYHGIPRIIKATSFPWLSDGISTRKENYDEVETMRPNSRKSSFDLTCEKSSEAECDVCNFVRDSNISEDACAVLSKWNEFLADYICGCRINLNVRQVLLPGELKLKNG